MDDEFNRCVELIDVMLESPEKLHELIPELQQIAWNFPDDERNEAWKIIGDLAYDLDFYESDPARRSKDYSFYDKDRAIIEIKKARERLRKLTEQ
jgi:hypothetical protein